MMPPFAPTAMPSTGKLVENRCDAARLSPLIAQFRQVPRNHINTLDIDAAQFVQNISQANNTQQPSSQSGTLKHQPACHRIEPQIEAEQNLATE